jgi:hypothetical protein
MKLQIRNQDCGAVPRKYGEVNSKSLLLLLLPLLLPSHSTGVAMSARGP